MRRNKSNLLLAVSVLVLIAAPALVSAAPDPVEVVVPIPPSRNSQTPRPLEGAPVTPPTQEPSPATAAPQNFDNSIKRTLDRTIERMLSPSDAQVGEKLRAIVTGKQVERSIGRGPERRAVETFYAARDFAPLWIGDGKLNARAKSVIARLKNAANDGLDPADYPVPKLGASAEADMLAEDDLKLTNAILTYARHLATGRIAPNRVLEEIDYGNHAPEPADILRNVVEAGDAGAALESYNPPHDGFRLLKAKLAELRASSTPAGGTIADGPVIRPGMRDARIPELRVRLHLRGKPGNMVYDRALFNAVRQFQQHAGMMPTGLVDRKTIAALHGLRPGQKIERVIANMERWRWLPRDLGKTYVMVNIPDYTLKVVHGHDTVWRTKIVAGKPQTPTPLLSASMDTVLVNPSWHVPQSIIRNELLPRYARDPNIFDRMGLEVRKARNGNISVVQPPGAANALGRIKFNFPNNFQVYLHDTPQKRLFAADQRAFSHGCMRVEDPTKFGEVVLHLAMNGATPDSRQLQAMFGKDERTFRLVNKPMVHLTYQTTFMDDGRLVLRDDIYGYDARIIALMHSDEGHVAEATPPQDVKRDQAAARSSQKILRRAERREADNPETRFDRLFR